jgi:hypothetical protein
MSSTKDSSVVFPVDSEGRSGSIGDGTLDHWTVLNGPWTVPRTRTGQRLPHYYDIISAGGNATTSMNAVFASLDYSRASDVRDWAEWHNPSYPSLRFRRENRGDVFIYNNQNSIALTSTLFDSKTSTSFVDNLALANFYAKLRATHTQFEGYIFAGELGETLHMLRKPFLGIRSLGKDFLDTLRKRKRANPKKWLNDIGSAWLEQSFGWNPFLNDVSDAVKAYRRLTKPVHTYRVSASAKKRYDNTKAVSSIYYPGFQAQYLNGNFYFTVASGLYETHTVRYRGAIRAKVKAPPWQNDDLFGFNPQNFVPAAWELLPWSFLADYFTNIGDILNASITSTDDIDWVNKTVIVEVAKHGFFKQVNGTAPGAGWSLYAKGNSSGFHNAKKKYVTRSAGVGIGLPTLQFNFDLAPGQLANIDALLSQASALHPQQHPRNWHR